MKKGLVLSNAEGFNLVEVSLSIAIIAIILYSLITIFITSGARGTNVEIFTVAQALGEGKLEEIMAKDFDDVSAEAETSYTGDFDDFSYQVEMDFVSEEALDIPVGYTTDYKKIVVMIRHPVLRYKRAKTRLERSAVH